MRRNCLKWLLCCSVVCLILINQFLISLLVLWISEQDELNFDDNTEGVEVGGYSSQIESESGRISNDVSDEEWNKQKEEFATQNFEGQVVRPRQCYSKKYEKLPLASVTTSILSNFGLLVEIEINY